MRGYGRVRQLFEAQVIIASQAIKDGLFYLDYGIRRRRPVFIEEGFSTLHGGVRDMLRLLGNSRIALRNRPITPETPAEWFMLVDEGIEALYKAGRGVRRARGRVSATSLKKFVADVWKIEERVVFNARTMRETFMARWPRLWTDRIDRKYFKWYARKLK